LSTAEGSAAVQTKIEMSTAKKFAHFDVTLTHEFDKFWLVRWRKAFKRSIKSEYWWEVFKPLFKLIVKFA